jgi:hypothetical protein
MPTLTTQEAASRLGRGVSTVTVWCQQGLFPNAKLEQSPRGSVWLIPERDLKNFSPPKRGRKFKIQPQPKRGAKK